MKNITKFKFILASILLTILATVASSGAAMAAQVDYNNPNNQPVQTPRFNFYTNVPNGIGNEADFVTLRKSSGDPTVPASINNFIDPVNATCTVGEKFDIRTYIHNGANVEFNNNGTGTAVAKNVNVAMKAPLGKNAKNFTFSSTISASNADSVQDNGTLNCSDEVQLKLVPQTVKVYTKHIGWTNASDSSINGNLAIGSREAGSGTQWGCWDDRVIVVYVVEVVAKPQPPTPIYTCDAILVEKIGEKKYKFGVRYTANNGAALKSVSYNFGDSNNKTVSASPFTAEHAYSKAGEFKVTTKLSFTVNGEEKIVEDTKCGTTIKTSVTPCPTNPSLPKDDPRCEPCPLPGKQDLPKDDPKCKETPVTEIPKTGAGEIVAGLFGTSATAYGAYAWVASRRALKDIR
jgi:hypothetical protein